MIDAGLLTYTAVSGGYEWLRVWHERQMNPPHLPRHALLLFQAFKVAYDGKDLQRLSRIIAGDFQGDVYGVRTKEELLRAQGAVFARMPWGVWPCLIVNVYCILQDDPASFRCVIDTQSRLTVLGIPTFNYDSAPLRCEIRPRGDGVWQLSSAFVEWELVKK